MGSNLFTSALSGMNAAQVALATTQHNIANASTPGFTRQEVLVTSNPAQPFGGGFIGQGVNVTGVQRIYDQFLSSQILQEQAQARYLTTYHSSLKQIDNLVADPTAGASGAMRDFFSAMNGVANNPESIPARQTLLSNAEIVSNRFQAIDQRLTDISNGLNSQVTSSVDSINSYAKQIAALNGNIKRGVAAGQGQQPNDLQDQRDLLITKLNQEIKTTTLLQADGTVSVFIGNGQTLVVDEQAMSLRVMKSAQDPSKLDIAYQNNNITVTMQQSSLQGGNIGAYLDFRDKSLEPMRNELGIVAIGMAVSVNQQNQAGLDLRGEVGEPIFDVAVPRVDVNANNQGTAIVSATIADVDKLVASDYRLKVNGTNNYTLVRLSDNFTTNIAANISTSPQTVDGFTFTLASGAAKVGDSFLIRPTANAARDMAVVMSDPAKIAAAAPIRTSAELTNTGSATISSGMVNTPLPLDANLQNKVTVTFIDATHFTVTDDTLGATLVGAPGTVYDPNAGATLLFNGWTAQISGAPAADDVFTVGPNTNATGDNRNALLMAGLQNQNILANGTSSLQAAYGQLVGQVGAKTNELAVTSEAQNNMVAETIKAQQSISGVNLDEEAANLMRFQRAYEAAAKAMQISNTMFDAVLALGG